MGTSRNAAQLVGKIDQFAQAVPAANRKATLQAAMVVKKSTLDRMRVASGGDLKLSGVGKKGARIGVRYDINGQVSANALVKATGPVQLVENRTHAHVIGPKGVKGGKRLKNGTRNRTGMSQRQRAIDEGTAVYKRGQVLFFGGRFSAYAYHPGTAGKHPWAKGIKEATPKTPKVYQDAYHRALTEAFR